MGVSPLIKIRASTDTNFLAQPAPARRSHLAVFLDRDGVLVNSRVIDGVPHPPLRLSDVLVPPGTREACASLKRLGLRLIVVTNQPDIARGLSDIENVQEINQYLLTEFDLDAVYMCPHDDSDGCKCRKPAPGLITEAAIDFGIALQESTIVGDRWRDIEAGRRAGCRTMWIRREYAEKPAFAPDAVAASLADAVPWIVAELGESPGNR
ncbi:MAG: HAD-IIIA family hydrolase [Acidimicrobiales bacterium]